VVGAFATPVLAPPTGVFLMLRRMSLIGDAFLIWLALPRRHLEA